MTSDEREAIIKARDTANREAVASVHVPIKLLTDKERKEFSEVVSKLAAGENPYARMWDKAEGKGTADAGGLDIDRATLKTERDAQREVVTESRRAELEAKWSARPTTWKVPTVRNVGGRLIPTL